MSEEQQRGLGGMLIFCVVFIGLFVALLGVIPNEFYAYQEDYEEYEYPSYFSMEDIEHIKYYINHTVEKGDWGVEFDYREDIDFLLSASWIITPNYIYFDHVKIFLFKTYHLLRLGNERWYINKDYAISQWDASINASTFYPLSCDHISVKVWLMDNDTTRNNLGQAWDENVLIIGIGFGYDDVATKYNIWDVIGRLLTFQSLEIFGLTGTPATILNLMISLPLWVSIIYLIYRLILLAIPFVGG